MSASPSPPSSSYDPSVANIEQRIGAHITATDNEDDDDMDMDYQPAVEDMSEDWVDEDDEDEEDEDSEFQEASEGMDDDLGNLFVMADGSMEETGEEGEDDETETEGQDGAARQTQGRSTVFVTREQIMNLLGNTGLRRLLASQNPHIGNLGSDDDDDDDDNPFGLRRIRRRRTERGPPEFEKVPSRTGQDLIMSGTFGNNDRSGDSIVHKKKLAYRLMMREIGGGSYGRQRTRNSLLKHELIPGSKADQIIHYNARCYSGQFSADGNFFFSCSQDFKVRMYDTSNPYSWKYYKAVDNPYGRWTITDASLSADNKWLAYSSISRIVCLAPTDPLDSSEPRVLDFSRMDTGRRARGNDYDHFGIWSLRFSGDGREIVAGTSDSSVYVYDVERHQSVLRIPGHDNDVNAVCFGDAASPHILYSGSDDTTLKVWDRRSLGDGRAAGVFLGHTEGLTFVDSKGDGRYIVSNGKDQTTKLWDLRKTIPTEKADRLPISKYTTGFDYRSDSFDFQYWEPHPHDCSLVTFRGHGVLKTLIRCHFSPPGSTDHNYIYSGSSDGKVFVWHMDGTVAKIIDVSKTTGSMQERPRYSGGYYGGGYGTCVRDASWHPDIPMIAATSWRSNSMGTCTIHTWNDDLESDEAEPKMGAQLTETLQDIRRDTRGSGRARRGWAQSLGLGGDDADDDDDF